MQLIRCLACIKLPSTLAVSPKARIAISTRFSNKTLRNALIWFVFPFQNTKIGIGKFRSTNCRMRFTWLDWTRTSSISRVILILVETRWVYLFVIFIFQSFSQFQSVVPDCSHHDDYINYLNDPTVRKALKIPPNVPTYESCK